MESAAVEASDHAATQLGKPTVLVVDDAEELQAALCDTLRAAGYLVHCARNGAEALDYLLTSPAPGVIVLDLQMPVMSGWDLMAILRRYTRLARIPVLIISAGERLASVAHPHTLQKPFSGDALIDAIERIAKEPT